MKTLAERSVADVKQNVADVNAQQLVTILLVALGDYVLDSLNMSMIN